MTDLGRGLKCPGEYEVRVKKKREKNRSLFHTVDALKKSRALINSNRYGEGFCDSKLSNMHFLLIRELTVVIRESFFFIHASRLYFIYIFYSRINLAREYRDIMQIFFPSDEKRNTRLLYNGSVLHPIFL